MALTLAAVWLARVSPASCCPLLPSDPVPLPACVPACVPVLFGVLIGVVVAAMVSVWFMTWPRTTAAIVSLLWLVVALLMLLGTGGHNIVPSTWGLA